MKIPKWRQSVFSLNGNVCMSCISLNFDILYLLKSKEPRSQCEIVSIRSNMICDAFQIFDVSDYFWHIKICATQRHEYLIRPEKVAPVCSGLAVLLCKLWLLILQCHFWTEFNSWTQHKATANSSESPSLNIPNIETLQRHPPPTPPLTFFFLKQLSALLP